MYSVSVEKKAAIGLSEREKKSYSIMNLIRHQCGLATAKEVGLELECSRTIADTLGIPPYGVYVPISELPVRSTYQTGIPAQGGSLVATVQYGEWVDYLKSKALVFQLGAELISGLQGNVDIPRQITSTPVYWIGEGDTVPETSGDFDLLNLTPKTCCARSFMTKRMVSQAGSNFEDFVRRNLADSIAAEVDRVVLNGTGSATQPLGILNATTGSSPVHVEAIGTDGGVLTWAHVTALEAAIAARNGDGGSMAYLATPGLRRALRNTLQAPGTEFCWQDFEPGMGMMNGYAAYATTNLPSNLSKGVNNDCHALVLGDFSSAIVGEWGILDLVANPYGAGFDMGTVQLRAMYMVDCAIRHGEKFAVIKDARLP